MDPQPEPVSYICGDCGMENTLKQGDVIQCRECGYRILYKKRTRRRLSFEGKPKRENLKRTIFASSGSGSLQMVSKPDSGRCASLLAVP
ncbi:DNA-directed RNA polymerases II, IV and V subunit 12, partial [Cucurbita argyrosperma subsp. argyrosperma]